MAFIPIMQMPFADEELEAWFRREVDGGGLSSAFKVEYERRLREHGYAHSWDYAIPVGSRLMAPIRRVLDLQEETDREFDWTVLLLIDLQTLRVFTQKEDDLLWMKLVFDG